MDMLLICKDALENSLVTNLTLAMEARKQGMEVGILFTEDALVALGGQSWDWSPLLRDWNPRVLVARNAAKLNLPLATARGRHETDVGQLLKAAKEAGVSLLACPIWASLLELEGKLAPEITQMDFAATLKALREAKTVVGGF